MTTERFFAPNVPSVRFGRRFLRDLRAGVGNLPIVSYSWSSHPKTERWYRLIGYELYEVDRLRRAFVLRAALSSAITQLAGRRSKSGATVERTTLETSR